MTRVALVFPGQGSQAPGMADGLLELPLAQELLRETAAAGMDLRTLLQGDAAILRPTEVAQPALFLVETVLAAEFRRLRPDLEIVAAAGHSVGEYAAATLAGALQPAQAMRLVLARGQAMAQAREGTMAALLGVSVALAEEICRDVSGTDAGVVVVANINAPGQVVISGTTRATELASQRARDRGAKRVIALEVSGAFHSPLMQPAADVFNARLDAETFLDPRFPVVCNVDGEPTSTAAGIRAKLCRQLTAPVRWVACIETLAALGVDALYEVGPGAVLAGLGRRLRPELPTVNVRNMEDVRSTRLPVALEDGR